MSWVSAADTAILSGDKLVRVHFAQSCVLNPTNEQIQSAIAAAGGSSGDGTVSSVNDVSGDLVASLSNPFSILTQFYVATISPVDGIQVGDLRNTIYNALVALSSVSAVSCKNWSVGTIEYDDGSTIGGAVVDTIKGASNAVTGGGPSISSTLSLGFLAVIAVVILIFVKVR